MLQLLFVFFALSTIAAGVSISHTTITPNADDLVQGSWTVSIVLSSSTSLEVDIETLFNQIKTVTLLGPTTFVSVVRIRSDAPSTAITAAITQHEATNAPSPSPTLSHLPTSTISSDLSRKSLTITQNQPAYGKDPDSVFAEAQDAHYAQIDKTWKPNPYIPATVNLHDCIIWDSSCKGDRSAAVKDFFLGNKAGSNKTNSTVGALLDDPCFVPFASAGGTNCTSNLIDPATASFFADAKNYMRQSDCPKDFSAAHTTSASLLFECCSDQCAIYGPNVDVYYWPDPDADTSCLDIIGSSVLPETAGAQTDQEGVVYWAATTDLYDIYVPTVTTALITTINDIVVKMALSNPWDNAPPSITTTRPIHTTSNQKRDNAQVHPRDFKALVPRLLMSMNGSEEVTGTAMPMTAGSHVGPASIAVSDEFTFTSPSVYVAFYSLSATDSCGQRGPIITSTMLAFAPGELFTVQGHLWGGGLETKVTRPFDFKDLPCPPHSIAYDDWWMPAPGEPYRPLIALPDKVRNLDPLWKTCSEAFYFTGLDPARTLAATSAMIPDPTPAADPEPKLNPAQSIPGLPHHTRDPVANDPSGDKQLAPPPSLQNEGNVVDPSKIDGGGPSPTTQEVDPGQEAAFKVKGPVQPIPYPVRSSPAEAAQAAAVINLSVISPLSAVQFARPGSGVDPGSDQQNHADPNELSPSQVAQLHQALVPVSIHSPETNPGNADPHEKSGSDHIEDQLPTAPSPGPSAPAHIVIGTGTFEAPSTGTTTIGSHTVAPNGQGYVVNGQQVNSNALPQNIDNVPVQIQGPAEDKSPDTGSTQSPNKSEAPENGQASISSPHTGKDIPSDSVGSQLPQGSALSVTTIAGLPVVNNQGTYHVDGKPLLPGSEIAISGTTWSVGSQSLPVIHVGDQVYNLPKTEPPPSQSLRVPPGPILIVPGGQVLTQAPNVPNAYIVSGSTVTVQSGTVMVGSSAIAVATSGASGSNNGALSVGNYVFTPMQGGSEVAYGGSILSLNGPGITTNGTKISLASAGLAIGSSTYAFATPAQNAAATTTARQPLATGLAGMIMNAFVVAMVGAAGTASSPSATISTSSSSTPAATASSAAGSNTQPPSSSAPGPKSSSESSSNASAVPRPCSCWSFLLGALLLIQQL